MSDEQPNESNLAKEFRQLGDNLVKAMRAAWDSPERKRVESEISSGVSELSRTLRNEAERLTSSGVAQHVKAGAGEMGTRLREELVSALKVANAHLAEAAVRLENRAGETGEGQSSANPGAEEAQSSTLPQTGKAEGMPAQPAGDVTSPAGDTGHREIHPDDVNASPADTGHREVHPDDVES